MTDMYQKQTQGLGTLLGLGIAFWRAFWAPFCPWPVLPDSPMAMACLRLVTLPPRPPLPLRRVPFLRFFIARSTSRDALGEYFRAMVLSPNSCPPKPERGTLRTVPEMSHWNDSRYLPGLSRPLFSRIKRDRMAREDRMSVAKSLVRIALVAVALAPSLAAAQSDYPNKQIRLMVGFPPGGSTDVLSRTLAQEARKALGQEIIVINKPGATGALAVTDVATSPADGYTIGVTPSSAMTLAHEFQNIDPTFSKARTRSSALGGNGLGWRSRRTATSRPSRISSSAPARSRENSRSAFPVPAR